VIARRLIAALIAAAPAAWPQAERPGPDNSQTYCRLDALHAERERPGAAQEALELAVRALGLSRPDPGLLWRHGRAVLVVADRERGRNPQRYERAERSLRQSVDMAPDVPEARYWHAVSLARLAQPREALREAERALAASGASEDADPIDALRRLEQAAACPGP
jgi:tetratricopeptide (TPR) repeat protein